MPKNLKGVFASTLNNTRCYWPKHLNVKEIKAHLQEDVDDGVTKRIQGELEGV